MLQMSHRPCTASCRSPWYDIEPGSHFNVVVKIKESFNSCGFLPWLQLSKSLTSCDILLGLLAAATHDLDHPGVNQPFLIKTNHYLATLYRVNVQNQRH